MLEKGIVIRVSYTAKIIRICILPHVPNPVTVSTDSVPTPPKKCVATLLIVDTYTFAHSPACSQVRRLQDRHPAKEIAAPPGWSDL